MRGCIFKYPISKIGEVVTIKMPQKFAICDVHFQGDTIFIWALGNTDDTVKDYKFIVHGTGWQIEKIEKLFFLKTVHLPQGLVWHVFMLNEGE